MRHSIYREINLRVINDCRMQVCSQQSTVKYCNDQASTSYRCYRQGPNHVLKDGGPIPWSRVLLPLQKKIRQVYPVWCSRLHNHTLFIKSYVKSWVVRPNFGGLYPLLSLSDCAHGYRSPPSMDQTIHSRQCVGISIDTRSQKPRTPLY